jgi:hypothetical protein
MDGSALTVTKNSIDRWRRSGDQVDEACEDFARLLPAKTQIGRCERSVESGIITIATSSNERDTADAAPFLLRHDI